MRITDLLDKRSVSLTAAPKTKSETLDMAVDLMVKSENSHSLPSDACSVKQYNVVY